MKTRQFSNLVLVTVGFILSPLSWWNDLIINVPLAYLFSWPFSLIHEQLFVPAFVFGYWLSNLLGFLMLHFGGSGLLQKQQSHFNIKQSIIVSIIYSVIMIAIVMLGWLAPPTEYLKQPG
ncbi:MAG: hypothetical protein ACN4GM_07700 [Gammaproteobacteria bacterium]